MKNIKEIVEELSEKYPLNTFGGETKEELLNVLSKSIDQTREETISDVEEGLPNPHEEGQCSELDKTDREYYKEGYNTCWREIKQSLIQLRK